MTLSFTTRWGKQMGELAGKENYFVEKIWKSFHEYHKSINFADLNKEDFRQDIAEYDLKSMRYVEDQLSFLEDEFMYQFNKALIDNWAVAPKLHSIREDIPDRWKPGNKIHFVINNRTKNRFQFAPVVEVKSVQKIEIEYHGGNAHVYISNDDADTIKQLNRREINELALNDGFNSVIEFFKWFNTDFSGKIIHWTNKTY